MLAWLLGAVGLAGGGIGIAALLGGGPWMLLVAEWLWSWLSHATFLQVVCAALTVALVIDHAALTIEHRHSAKLQTQLTKAQSVNHGLQAQLDSISAKRNAQKQTTLHNIDTVKQTIHDAEGRAQKVETAPLPGNCKSPPEVLGADL